MATQQPPDVLAYYAQLSFQADVHRANSRPVPPLVLSEMQAIEARASAHFSPQQLSAAISYVNVAKSQLHTQFQGQMQRERKQTFQKDLGDLSRKLTVGIAGQSGLSPEQFKELNEKGQVTLRAGRRSQAEKDAEVREATKRFDRRGFGFTEAEWEKRLDQMVGQTEEGFKALAQNYNVPVADLRNTAKQWESARVEHGFNKRMQAQTPEKDQVIKATDDDNRRAAVVNAYLQTSGSSESSNETAFHNRQEERARRDNLEDTGIRGALAKSYEALERGVEVQQVDREVRDQQQRDRV